MKFSDLNKNDFASDILNGTAAPILAEKYKVSVKTIFRWKAKLGLSKTINTPTYEVISEDKREIHKLQTELKLAKKALEQAKSEIHLSSELKRLVFDLKKVEFNTVPEWVDLKPSKNNVIVPCIQLTDIHYGEVQDPAEVNYINQYNSAIAEMRVNEIVDDHIKICKVNMSNYTYPGVVVIFSGDNITGNLHDLAETNDMTPIQQVIGITSLLIKQLEKYKKAFGKVFVPCVTGNHSRLAKYRTKTKGRVNDSLETIVHYFIAEHFKNDKDVTLYFDESDEVYFKVNGRRFMLNHGDSFRGGGGVGGHLIPIKRGQGKKLSVANAMNKGFDTMVIGHWHSHHVEESLIIGASPKGYDAFVKMIGLPHNDPGATTWFVNAHGDIIFATMVKCREDEKLVEKREKSVEIF